MTLKPPHPSLATLQLPVGSSYTNETFCNKTLRLAIRVISKIAGNSNVILPEEMGYLSVLGPWNKITSGIQWYEAATRTYGPLCNHYTNIVTLCFVSVRGQLSTPFSDICR